MSHKFAAEVSDLLPPGCVENPRDTYGYRSGFRLAGQQNLSALLFAANFRDTTLGGRRIVAKLTGDHTFGRAPGAEA